MFLVIANWILVVYKRTISSIAFLPGVIALLFLGLSVLMTELDFSETGKSIKKTLTWLSLRDGDTARSICASIAGGLISLTVFSFSLVMLLLNQAASQMSNRILDKLIGNRFQQIVLGFYIGTIVYSFFVLSTIRTASDDIDIPALSVYLLIFLTIIDIFLFIYFLHYVTETIKYETVIHKIYDQTKKVLKDSCLLTELNEEAVSANQGKEITANSSGLYQGFDMEKMLEFCSKEDVKIKMQHTVGTYIIKGTTLLKAEFNNKPSEDFEENLCRLIQLERVQNIKANFYYGFHQLMEIAIKGLSPGINDPGTAVISLRVLGDLLAYRLHHFPKTHFEDKKKVVRIITKEKDFEDIFEKSILPIWDYGKNDRLIQHEMRNVLTQLKNFGGHPCIDALLKEVQQSAL